MTQKSVYKEQWFKTRWRPAMAWMYMAICLFDFLVAPVITFYFFGRFGSDQYSQWQPITLIGSGLFHVAMGAIIGVTAWQRGEEKKTQYRTRDYRYDYDEQEQPADRAAYRDRLNSKSSREGRFESEQDFPS